MFLIDTQVNIFLRVFLAMQEREGLLRGKLAKLLKKGEEKASKDVKAAKAALLKAEEGASKVAKGASDEVRYPDSCMWGFFSSHAAWHGFSQLFFFRTRAAVVKGEEGALQGSEGSFHMFLFI
jgi:hypothetical protein